MIIKHLEGMFTTVSCDLILNCEDEELKFYLYLKLYAIGNKHSSFPSYARIEKDLGWDDRKIKRTVERMEDKGRLKVDRINGKSNVYDITWYDLVAFGTCKTGGEILSTPPNNGGIIKSNNIIINNNILTSVLKSQEKPEKETEVNKQVKEFISFYKVKFLECISDNDPIFNYAVATKLAKPHIKNLGLERLKELLVYYFNTDDDFYKKNAYSITCFLSASTLHKLVTTN